MPMLMCGDYNSTAMEKAMIDCGYISTEKTAAQAAVLTLITTPVPPAAEQRFQDRICPTVMVPVSSTLALSSVNAYR